MTRFGKRMAWIAAAVLCSLMVGCSMSNPSYFPYWLKPGDVDKSHAKPVGHGYYANFDPYACRVEVRPLKAANAVGTQQVLIATVYDASGQPRRGRRVEWHLEGQGQILEVDESGYAHDRGWVEAGKYAVSYTDYHEHIITRGNANSDDDFQIRPGQSWCVITSPIEGDSHITVYAPGIHNWDKRKVDVTVHWVNAAWTIPPPAKNRAGTPHNVTTNIYTFKDKQPLANYRVRYTMLDGPPAVFLPGQTRTVEVPTDLQGNATAQLVQTQPQVGVNRIGVEIIRPPERVTGTGIIIGRGETFKEWVAASIGFTKVGPPAVSVGQQFNYTLTVTNTGAVDTEALTVRDAIPEGLTFVGSNPQANQEGRELIWTLAPLPAGRSAAITATFRADRVGTVNNRASVVSADGIRAQADAVTNVAAPGLNLSITGPQTSTVGAPITYQVTVTNTGAAPAVNVQVECEFDQGLNHASGSRRLNLNVGTLAGGASRTESLVLTPDREGKLTARVAATADGGLSSSSQHTVTVARPQIGLRQVAPTFKFARSQVPIELFVSNTGTTPLVNVVVRQQLPPELSFVNASDGGVLEGNQVVWRVGQLGSREERRLQMTATAEVVTPKAVSTAVATADPGIMERADAYVEIRGAPGLRLEMVDIGDPAQVGSTVRYEINVTNTGTLVANTINLTATIPPQMELISSRGPGNMQGQLNGNVLGFQKVERLEAGQKLVYEITCRAKLAGDARMRVMLQSDSLGAEPVIKEEPTIVNPALNTGTPGTKPTPDVKPLLLPGPDLGVPPPPAPPGPP
jgi:uncharacterized repeat protein (TIGR01451 family)